MRSLVRMQLCPERASGESRSTNVRLDYISKIMTDTIYSILLYDMTLFTTLANYLVDQVLICSGCSQASNIISLSSQVITATTLHTLLSLIAKRERERERENCNTIDRIQYLEDRVFIKALSIVMRVAILEVRDGITSTG